MSVKNTILIDAKNDLQSFFGEAFDKTNKRIMSAARHGVSNAINIIKNTTWANVEAIPYKMTKPTKMYGVPLIQGINAYMWKGQATGFVDIMGAREHNDGTWMLRWFAGGGAVRKNRGSIRGYMSLKSAYNSTLGGQMREIQQSISNAIDELNHSNK